jgi:hypothetical protein
VRVRDRQGRVGESEGTDKDGSVRVRVGEGEGTDKDGSVRLRRPTRTGW